MRIKNKMELRKMLHEEGYNFIAFDDMGNWTQDTKDNDTILILQRCNFYDKTYKEIDEKLKEILLIVKQSFPF